MARSANPVQANQQAAIGELSAEEQAQLDEMRASDTADAEPVDQQQDAGESSDAGDGAEPGQQADRRQQMVPHQALHEERERRKAAEATIAQERERMRLLEERTNLLLQQRTQPQPQNQLPAVPEIPAYEQDAAGHLLARQNQAERALAEVYQVLTARAQQEQHVQGVTSVQQRALAMEREFANQTPDYVQAVDHLAKARHDQLRAAGYEDAAERQAIISNEALGVAHRALQMGKNPAQVIYDIAKTYGYSQPAASTTTNGSNGAVEQPAASNGSERLQTLANGQNQARSLGNVRGSGPPPLTAQRLLELSDDEFLKMVNSQDGRDLLGT